MQCPPTIVIELCVWPVRHRTTTSLNIVLVLLVFIKILVREVKNILYIFCETCRAVVAQFTPPNHLKYVLPLPISS